MGVAFTTKLKKVIFYIAVPLAVGAGLFIGLAIGWRRRGSAGTIGGSAVDDVVGQLAGAGDLAGDAAERAADSADKSGRSSEAVKLGIDAIERSTAALDRGERLGRTIKELVIDSSAIVSELQRRRNTTTPKPTNPEHMVKDRGGSGSDDSTGESGVVGD